MLRGIASMILVCLGAGAYGEADWDAECRSTAEEAGTPGWSRACACLGEGIQEGASKKQVLKILAAPRGEKRGPIRAAGDETRRMVVACLQQFRGQGQGQRRRQGN